MVCQRARQPPETALNKFSPRTFRKECSPAHTLTVAQGDLAEFGVAPVQPHRKPPKAELQKLPEAGQAGLGAGRGGV